MTDNLGDGTTGTSKTTEGVGTELVVFGLKAVGHLLAVTTILVAISYPFLGGAFWRSVFQMSSEGVLWEHISGGFLAQIGISILLWGAIYFLGARLLSKGKQLKQGQLANPTGTVMTETVIIIIPATFLIMSLAQLAVNNITAVLVQIAGYQANRTAWLLEPDTTGGSSLNPGGTFSQDSLEESWLRGQKVDQQYIEEMARIQAALVLTPAAPGGYGVGIGEMSSQAKQARGIVVGSQIPVPFDDMGKMGMELAESTLAMQQDRKAFRQTFTRALDVSPYIMRSAKKFTFAYHCTKVDLNVSKGCNKRECVKTRLTYNHFNAFPLVNRIFPNTAMGQEGEVFGKDLDDEGPNDTGSPFGDEDEMGPIGYKAPLEGYYTAFEADRTRQAQLESNMKWPYSDNPEKTL